MSFILIKVLEKLKEYSDPIWKYGIITQINLHFHLIAHIHEMIHVKSSYV